MAMKPVLRIGEREVGPGRPVYLVAELSANHLHDFERAARLVEEAQRCGVDAVKLQTYTADTLTLDSDRRCFRIGAGSAWEGRTFYDLYREGSMPWDWQPRLRDLARSLGIELFSTPFDATAVEFLEELEVPVYKVSSFELVDLPLLARVAATGKPILLSTGMASRQEIAEAVEAVRRAGGDELALLHCTSAYPASPDAMNLRTIVEMEKDFGVPVGLSDHSLDEAVAVAAVALGACIVEKHFTLSRDDPGPDRHFSLEPAELRRLVEAVRLTERALGAARYGPQESEAVSLLHRRSLFVVRDVRRGEPLTEANVRSIRPADGLPPKYLPAILGRRAARDLERGTPLDLSSVVGGDELEAELSAVADAG